MLLFTEAQLERYRSMCAPSPWGGWYFVAGGAARTVLEIKLNVVFLRADSESTNEDEDLSGFIDDTPRDESVPSPNKFLLRFWLGVRAMSYFLRIRV